MSGGWIPHAWQTEAVPSHVKRYALIELASLAPSTRTALFASFEGTSAYWPLLDDERQPHLRREGPWLLEVNETRLNAWQPLDSLYCALHAWIESEVAGERLAAQLAPAMIVENLEGERSLLRFYLPEIIERLHTVAPDESRVALFGSVSRWWYRAHNKEWTALVGLPSRDLTDSVEAWQLKVSDELWLALHGNAEAMKLVAEFLVTVPEVFSDLCACDRPRLMAEVLEQADACGLTRDSDRRTFAYLQLTQAEEIWQTKEMRALLAQATSGEASLLELLETTYGEPS